MSFSLSFADTPFASVPQLKVSSLTHDIFVDGKPSSPIHTSWLGLHYDSVLRRNALR